MKKTLQILKNKKGASALELGIVFFIISSIFIFLSFALPPYLNKVSENMNDSSKTEQVQQITNNNTSDDSEIVKVNLFGYKFSLSK